MKRICFIGDSHLATLKFGWAAFARTDSPFEPVFFAGHGKTMQFLTVSGDTLTASNPALEKPLRLTSGGLSDIDNRYDHYVIHGLELGIALALEALRAINKPKKDRTGRMNTPDLADALNTAVRNSLAVRTLMLVRQISSAPVTLSPTPLSAQRCPMLRKRLMEQGRVDAVLAAFSEAVQRNTQKSNCSFLPQPAETLGADRIATQEIYSKNVARFSIKIPTDDNSHMNADYGAAVLRDLFATLAP